MKLPVQPAQYIQRIEQQRSSILEREIGRISSALPSDYSIGDIRKYGAIPGGGDASGALQAAIDACINTGNPVIIQGGDYRLDNQVFVRASAGTRCKVNFWQDRNSRLLSYVTGSVANYDTAGFAIVFDGWTESTWDGLSLNFTNGTAGYAVRCRYQESVGCNIINARILGGDDVTDRTDRTRISARYIGNESGYNANYVTYFHKLIAPYFNIANIHIDLLVGDGAAATKQPNVLTVIDAQFSRYMTAMNMGDTDEHLVLGAFHHVSTGVAVSGTPTITSASTTATVAHTAHGLETGDIIIVSGASPTEYNGTKKITVTGDDEYTYTVESGLSSPATGTISVVLATVGYRGDTTFSQIIATLEPGSNSIPYYIDDGGGAGNLINIINNTGLRGIVEDSTEENLILDRNYYGASGTLTMRVNGTDTFQLSSDDDVASDETALLIRHQAGGVFALERVSVGTSDSGGSGYRLLRIPN